MKYKLEFKSTSNRYTNEELLNNIKIVWDHKGKQPTVNDMNISPSKIGFHTYFNRFGSWKNSLKEFIKHNNGEIIINQHNKNSKLRKNINNSLRFDIFKRDNFKCIYCGSSPAINNNTQLEVDHVIPVSKGGDNSISNLKTICKECNSGKFNKL
jgi:hypothetical protein